MDWPEIAAIVYTVAWSVSFYGQIYDNWKLKKYKKQLNKAFKDFRLIT